MLVYMLLNRINQKVYVGQTQGYTISTRWNQSLSNQPNSHLSHAIRKYGPKSFKRTVLAYASCQEELDLLEKWFIRHYQSADWRFGYNMMLGGRQGPGRHISDVKERIAEGSRKMWARRTARERWEFNFAIKLQWLSRTEEERQEIARHIAKGMTGTRKPPQTAEHRKKISESLKMYFAKKNQLPPKKPPQTVKGPVPKKPVASATDKRATASLREVAQVQNQIRELRERLNALKFELDGGCNW